MLSFCLQAASVAGEDLYALHQIGRLAARAGLVGQIGTELHVRLPSPPDGSSADASDPDASDADEMEAGEDEDDWRKSRRLDGGRRKKIKRIPRSGEGAAYQTFSVCHFKPSEE